MQKINANNWISAARSCAPNSAPCQSATLAAFDQRRSGYPSERAPLSR